MKAREVEAAVRGAGVSASARITQAQIAYDPAFRGLCEQNSCGNYGKCWMCPPDVGDIHALIKEAKGYPFAVLYQTVTAIEDSFDFEGMEAAAKRHNAAAQTISRALGPGLPFLNLSSGGCRYCETCLKQSDKPCPFPDEAMASLEAYGMDVYKTATNAGLKYTNGQNTVTYFGMVLFH